MASAPASSGPAPTSSPIPLSSGDYASAAALAGNAYQNALAQINSQRQGALQQFGYTGTIDPKTGTLTDMHVDPNNPYGQFQDMLRQHALDQQQIDASNRARGLGGFFGPRGGGLAAQGLTADKFAFGSDSANLGQALTGTLADLQGQQTDAQNTMDNALWQAELSSAQNAIQNQAFNPADFTGITDQSPSGGGDVAPKLFTQPNGGGAEKLAPRVKSTPALGGHNAFARARAARMRRQNTAARNRPRRRR